MADPSTVVSFLASITSWFTPTALFLFVNLGIGILVITSRRKPHPQHDQLGPHHSHQLARPPSLIERVKSIDLSHFKFTQPNPEEERRYFPPTEPADDSNPVDPYPPQLQRAPSLLERVRSFNFTSVYKSQQPYPETETEEIDNAVTEPDSDLKPGLDPDNNPKRSKSETKKTTAKVREIVKRSTSEKSMAVVEEKTETVERRRPETTRPEKTASFDDDEGVDAKADDFINRFKKQLKLQRLDSFLRYKEMLKGS
ncbi:hypothetical protein ACOSP7_015173 [Xanthoceras sorbifolium]|uniref:DUF4408 domain-containing protein n=1 Tax=Xanthoceras sorbifolium TaxID=99658 RepID=A0ABQ8I682_9ROSI|nr:hypothetical protein JRO89_XS04G0208900 [Xanthoceras sorbifolium]